MPCCDFCASPKPVREFPANDVFDKAEGVKYVGAWAACAECATLIDKEAWDALAERGLLGPNGRLMVQLAGRAEALAQVKRLHRQFRANRVRA